ncbi:MAG: sugar phosphate nucleotidyltransferase [Pseudomonadota bacterium]
MKVLLFCGGMGMRLGGDTNPLPKPMVPVGDRPMVVHIMHYYAYFGHTEFILCVGWKADIIRDYFSKRPDCVPNDWTISVRDTGIDANLGQRLLASRECFEPGETFFANYADGLSSVRLSKMYEFHKASEGTATFVAVSPKYHSFHVIESKDSGQVQKIYPVDQAGVWMNGGFFIFDYDIFEHINEGEELVEEPFDRLINAEKLHAYHYPGFWGCMDTYKEKAMLDEMYASGEAPWVFSD